MNLGQNLFMTIYEKLYSIIKKIIRIFYPLIIEIKRNDNPFWSAVIFEDHKGKLHFYNPAITLEQFKEQIKGDK